MNSAAFQQLFTPQQWTEGRPQQQWRLQIYVCHVLEKKIVNGQNLSAKKKKKRWFCSSWSISVIFKFMSSIEQADSSRVLHSGTSHPLSGESGPHLWQAPFKLQRRMMSANSKAKRSSPCGYEVESLKAETAVRSASSWFRRDSGSSRRLRQREFLREKQQSTGRRFTHSKKKKRDLRSARSNFRLIIPRKFCESTFLQESVSTSALAPSLVLYYGNDSRRRTSMKRIQQHNLLAKNLLTTCIRVHKSKSYTVPNLWKRSSKGDYTKTQDGTNQMNSKFSDQFFTINHPSDARGSDSGVFTDFQEMFWETIR